MKIGVLTFHRCINYGSYWQARCLVEGLNALGHQAVLLDHHDAAVRRAEWRCALQPHLPEPSGKQEREAYGRKARKFFTAFDRLPLSPRFPLQAAEEAGDYDAVVVGSDEVWNFWHPWYAARPIFFGEGLRTDCLVSYAASFGNYRAEGSLEPRWAELLRRFDSVSVRDENSRRIVQDTLGCDPAMVLDPCLQFPPASRPHAAEAPYLTLYGHGFPDWFCAAVRRWADANGRRVVSIGYRADWADEERIEVSPEEFSALIAGADAVATNFFHGCVFALVHGRPFVCAPSDYRSTKVRDLTAVLGAERHLVSGDSTDADYAARLGSPLDPAIGARIAAMRETSSAFLARTLG